MPNIYMVGVGGQGIITASRIIGDAATLAGEKVLLSETHGMAQRGGTVICTARIGDMRSPLIPAGEVDAILSFELLETMRASCDATHKTMVISSSEKVVPLSASTQKLKYPSLEDVREALLKVAQDVVVIDAPKLAGEAGSRMSTNVVMVGALAGSGRTGLSRGHFEKAVAMNIPAKLEENLKAFSMGFEATSTRPRMF